MAFELPLPDLDIVANSEIIGSTTFCINLAAVGKPISMYSNFVFNSMSEFNDVLIGTDSGGVYSLFDVSTDNGSYIESSFEIYTDLKELGIKKIRAIRIHGSSSGNLELITKCDDSKDRYYSIVPEIVDVRHGFKVVVGKDDKGTYWRFTFRSIDGSSFSIDKLFVQFVRVQA